MSLPDFLLARVAEDEAAAATPEHTTVHGNGGYIHDRTWFPWRLDAYSCDERGGTLLQIDPARVLAECEAKRRIVARHGGEHFCAIDPPEGEAWWDCFEGDCPTMLTLALPYAGHPDYDESWRPY